MIGPLVWPRDIETDVLECLIDGSLELAGRRTVVFEEAEDLRVWKVLSGDLIIVYH